MLAPWFLALLAEDKGLAISFDQKTGRVAQKSPWHPVARQLAEGFQHNNLWKRDQGPPFTFKEKKSSYKDTYAEHELSFLNIVMNPGFENNKNKVSLDPDFLPQGLTNERKMLKDDDFFMFLCFC